MVQTHPHSSEEGMTMPLPPQEAKKIWHGPSDPQKDLYSYIREHLDWLHHLLVWQLLGIRPQGATEGSTVPCKSIHPPWRFSYFVALQSVI